MAMNRGLVFVSFFSEAKGVEKTCCDAILTHLKPLQDTNPGLIIWDYSSILAGANIDTEVAAAIGRCSIAVILMSPDYLSSSHWEREAKPLLELAEQRKIRLLWQLVSPSNCEETKINFIQQMIPGRVLRNVRRPERNQHELRISQIVLQAWKDAPTLSRGLGALPLDQIKKSEPQSDSSRTAELALVLTQPGGKIEGSIAYHWMVFERSVGKSSYQAISGSAIAHAGNDASVSSNQVPEVITRFHFPALLKNLMKWIDSKFRDPPILDIFVPENLLDEDWGIIVVKENQPLHTCQPYLLRSVDRLRLAGTEWKSRQGAFERMHQSLVAGDGVWMPKNMLTKDHVLKNVDGRHNEKAKGVISAICCLEPAMLSAFATWIWSALESMAPLVIWPSCRGALIKNLSEKEIRSLLSELALDLNSSPQCSDLNQLARSRQAKARDAEDWPSPKIDQGFRILVDHPHRAPDPSVLQALFPPSRRDPPPDAAPAAPARTPPAAEAPASRQDIPASAMTNATAAENATATASDTAAPPAPQLPLFISP